MSKQVDIKALVSHVVRGDGVQKCRICMGDTSEGQVHLGDTVMMDGEKPITLSELLETVTGVQVLLEGDLPTGVCPDCLMCALNAAEFRSQCQQAASQWNLTIELLNGLSSQYDSTEKTIFARLEPSQMIIIKDDNSFNRKNAANRLNDHLTKPKEVINEYPISCACPNCGKKFQFAHQLSHHLKESTDLLRACYICADIMPRNDLIGHMFAVHNKDPYDCKKCPAILCSYNQYKMHLSKSHAHAACTCVECGRSFQTQNAFYAHVSVHQSQNCPSCDKLFRNQTCYIHHVKSCCNLDKNREDMFRTKTKVTVEVKNEISKRKVKVGLRGSANKECMCDYCGKKFAGKKFVAAHIQIVHMKNTHRPCVYCGKFLAAAHMSEHVKKHEIDQSYSCEHCGVVLKTRLGYTQHLRLHTGERPYACKICGQTFSASSRRSEHIRKAHKNIEIVLKHACKFCPARFRLPYRLKKHLMAVHNNEDEKITLDFECKECNERFGSCRGLLHHSRKHQNIPFPPKKPEKTVMFKVFSESKTDTDKNVPEETELPRGLCCDCSNTALLVWQFRHLCQQSDLQWKRTVSLINHTDEIPSIDYKSIYICCSNETIYKDNNEVKSLTAATARFNFVMDRKAMRPKHKKFARIERESRCIDCGKKFALPYYLNKHLRNTLKRACTECGKILQRDKLARHLDKVHDKLVYYCEICHKLFDEKCSLNRHKDLYHSNVSFECHICRYGFTSERSLAAHMYSHTLFNCSSCNNGFENRKCYIYHKEKCKGEKINIKNIYECHDCGSKYTKKPSLRIHIVQKHLNVLPFVCQICGKRCSTRNHLVSHELVHETKRKVYECYCGAKMRSALGFEMHQRIHSGEKPYVCEICGDRFLSASRRLDHIKRKHRSKEQGHGCDKCEAKFVRPFELKKHYRSVHLINILKEEPLIPKGLCISCSSLALSAYEFRRFTRNSSNLWINCINTLGTLPKLNTQKSIYAIIKDNMSIQTVNSFEGKKSDLVEHLSNRLIKKKPVIVEKKPRHPRTGPACSCKDCGKSFSSPYFLNLHLRNSGQKEACWLCGAMMARGRELREHLAIVHKTDMFLCPECPNLFNSEHDRKRHLKKYHCLGNLTCSDCGRNFQRKTSFEVHTQMHAVRTCRACGVQFSNRGCYREHRAKCEPDAKPDRKTVPRSRRSNVRDPATFTCDYCGKTYHLLPQLKNHIMWIHMDVRPHQCQWCGKRFYTPARLAEHTVVHTRVRNFECDICNAKLVSKMAAVYHRRRHTGERPYECQDCGERFISSSRRSEHAKRRHNRGLRLKCLQCHSTFVRNHELKKHMEKVHGNAENNVVTIKIKKVKQYPGKTV